MFEFLCQYLLRTITGHTDKISPYNTLLVCTLCLRISVSLQCTFFQSVIFCQQSIELQHLRTRFEYLNSLPSFFRIQWRMTEVFHLRWSWGCCRTKRTGLCLRCSSAAICRAWLGCSSDFTHFPWHSAEPAQGTDQPRLEASVKTR